MLRSLPRHNIGIQDHTGPWEGLDQGRHNNNQGHNPYSLTNYLNLRGKNLLNYYVKFSRTRFIEFKNQFYWWVYKLVLLMSLQTGFIDEFTNWFYWWVYELVLLMSLQTGFIDEFTNWFYWWVYNWFYWWVELVLLMSLQTGFIDELNWFYWWVELVLLMSLQTGFIDKFTIFKFLTCIISVGSYWTRGGFFRAERAVESSGTICGLVCRQGTVVASWTFETACQVWGGRDIWISTFGTFVL